MLVNHENHQAIDIIESRDEKDVIALLLMYPNIEKITRDGSYTYTRAINEALPHAIQISDRFHLFQRLSRALKADLIMILPAIIKIDEAAIEEIECLPNMTQKEKAEVQRHERMQEMAHAMRERHRECGSIKTVMAEFGLSYRTVKKYLAHEPVRQRHDKGSSVTAFFEIIYDDIRAQNKTFKIYKKIKELGYSGTFSNMLKWIRVQKSKGLFSSNCISRGDLLKLLFNQGVNDLAKGKQRQERLIRYLKTHKYIHRIIMLVTEFRIVMFSKNPETIHTWLATAKTFSELKNLQSFVRGTSIDIKAVENAITHDESNGVVEGIVGKIKKIKRVHYGRCGFELLKQKILE